MIVILNIAVAVPRKRFSVKCMDFKLEGKVTEGMWKYVTSYVKNNEHSFSAYLRKLIMKDLKIDEYGKEKK